MNNIVEIILAVVVIILAVTLLNPTGLFMPQTAVMGLIAVFAVIVGIFAGLIWRERARDEREILLRQIASRGAYVAGLVVVAVGIISQELQHRLDPWLVTILVVMVVAKLVGLIYGQIKH